MEMMASTGLGYRLETPEAFYEWAMAPAYSFGLGASKNQGVEWLKGSTTEKPASSARKLPEFAFVGVPE